MSILNLDAIPAELQALPQWVNWRYETRGGKQTKVPYVPNGHRADTTNPKTWSAFADCVNAHHRFDGIGIVCANGLAGVDLDHCIDDAGNLSELARRVVTALQTYTEITPSGRGVRCLCWGKLPKGGRRKDVLGIEMYDHARYFTVTGNRLPNTPATIEHRDRELARLHAEIFGTESCANAIAPRAESQATSVSLDDAQIIAQALRAENGDAFARLWNGDITAHNGNHSDADLALCSHLAFWTGGNAAQMDRLFRQSGLMRCKWDERHNAQGETYGQMTIAKAIASVRAFYTPTCRKNTMPIPRIQSSPKKVNTMRQVQPLESLARQVDAIPSDTDKLQLSQLLRPVLEELAKLDKAAATTFLLRKVKLRFGLTRVELTAYESDLVKLRCEWERAEAKRQAEEAVMVRAQAAKPKEMSDAERAEAIAFLKDARLIERIAEDITNLGYVGEDGNKVVLYLVASSRKQDNPLSVVLKSPSSFGKSEMVKGVAVLMPPEDVREYTRLTAQALSYMPSDGLQHKLLIVMERDGSEASDYTIRVMQSEKVIRIAYPVKDPETGKMRTAEHQVNGPMAYIETTTRPTIHSENATRVFELYLDGSEQQTRKIHAVQRKNATLEGLRNHTQREAIIRRHQNAQRLLNPVSVVIPFAEFINFPADNPRTRRDLPRFLEMIKVVAFLRQYQKERKKESALTPGEKLEYIEADLADYEMAYRYAAPVIASGLDELPKHSRALFEKIVAMVETQIVADTEGKKTFTRRDIRRHCNVTDKFVKDYIAPLEDKEYLEIVSGDTGKGKKYVYQISEAALNEREGAAIVKGLTTPEELAEILRLAGLA